MVYGMWACWCVLGAPGVAMVFLHATIAFCVAQFRSMLLSWLCSLLLLSTLRLQSVDEVKVGVPLLHTLPQGRGGCLGSQNSSFSMGLRLVAIPGYCTNSSVLCL